MVSDSSSSIHRTVDILQVLGSVSAGQSSSLGVLDIARRVGREKTQVSRALKALAETGLVERDEETMAYRLGWQFYALAVNAGDRRLRDAALPILRRLVAAVKERAHLSILRDGAVLTVLSEGPLRAVQVADWVGRTSPVHTTSSGRALLMDWNDEQVLELLSETEFTATGPNSPPDADTFLARLRQGRERGYAKADEEFEDGLVAVAAPVRDFQGLVVASLNVSAPKFCIGGELDQIGRAVQTAAAQLSSEMRQRSAAGNGQLR
ncbi:IclR family transcriptional regulator [Nocardiopsis nanhaiensis]